MEPDGSVMSPGQQSTALERRAESCSVHARCSRGIGRHRAGPWARRSTTVRTKVTRRTGSSW